MKYLKLFVVAVFGLSAALSWLAFPALSTEAQSNSVLRWRPRQTYSSNELVGDAVCATCHAAKVASQKKTAMARALERPNESEVLQRYRNLTFEEGSYSYRITREDERQLYVVTNGTATISATIAHALGHGKSGQTYLLSYGDKLYESRLSFYAGLGGLDLTAGATKSVPPSLTAALGREMQPDDIRDCFGCHSTGAVNGLKLQLEQMVPGVRCEACHGPGAKHVAAIKAGNITDKLIFNPAVLGGDQLNQEFCGACHRSADAVAQMPQVDEVNRIRFQPYRIYFSACYSNDRRISCTACHDPHNEVKQAPEFYDAKCLACHQAEAKGNFKPAPHPAETKGCVTCHMPKVLIPDSHTEFTDHNIQIVKPANSVKP